MAYGRSEQKEHSYKRIHKDLKEGRIGNLLLLYGKEQYLVDWSIGLIVDRFVNAECRTLDFTKFEPEKVTIDEIKGNCETLTMFSERRVVVVSDFPPLQGGKAKNFGEAQEKELIEYLARLPGSCILILTAESADKRKKLYKALEANGTVYEFDSLDERQLRSFIDKRFRASGKLAKLSVIDELIQNNGYYHKETDYTLYNMENDIKKIIAHSVGEDILLSDVLTTIAGNLEINIFAMLDAVSRNRKDEAYRLLFNLVAAGENVYMILSMISSQFELILEVKELREEGRTSKQIQDALKVHEFRIKKAAGFGDRYTVKGLRRILEKIYQVDRNIKTGLLEQNLAMEMLIAEI